MTWNLQMSKWKTLTTKRAQLDTEAIGYNFNFSITR